MIQALMDLGNEQRTDLLEQAKAEGFVPSPWYCDTDIAALEAELAELEQHLLAIDEQLAGCDSKTPNRSTLWQKRLDVNDQISATRQFIANPVIQSADEWLLQAYVEDRLMNAKRVPEDVKSEAFQDAILAIAKSGDEPDIDALEIQIANTESEITKHVVMTGSHSEELYVRLHRLKGEMYAYYLSDDELADVVKKSQSPWKAAPKLIDAFLDRFKNGTLPKPYVLSGAFHGLEIGPGEITILGGYPGVGKTAAAMQIISELRRNHADVLVYIANAESSFDSMMMREIARTTGIPSSRIRRGELTNDEKAKIVAAAVELRKSMTNIEWLTSEFSYAQVCATSSEPPGLLVCDYLQKFAPATEETRVGITMVMSALRQFANNGWSVLALSALNRTTVGGSTNLAAFRDSSEIEYNADAAYILERRIQDDREFVRLNCLKNRHDKPTDIDMDYHPETMEFTERFQEIGETADNLWGADDDDQ